MCNVRLLLQWNLVTVRTLGLWGLPFVGSLLSGLEVLKYMKMSTIPEFFIQGRLGITRSLDQDILFVKLYQISCYISCQ